MVRIKAVQRDEFPSLRLDTERLERLFEAGQEVLERPDEALARPARGRGILRERESVGEGEREGERGREARERGERERGEREAIERKQVTSPWHSTPPPLHWAT